MKSTHAKFLIGLAACGAIVIAGTALFTMTGSRPAEHPVSTPQVDLPLKSPHQARHDAVSSKLNSPVKLEKDHEIEGFASRSFNEQLQELSSLAAITDISVDRKRFLKRLLHDKRLNATVRNNLANILANQRDPDPSLWESFSSMASDSTETYQWREYSVQHLADSLRYSRNVGEISQILWEFIENGEKGMPGTALLLVSRLNIEGKISIPDSLPELLGRIIRDDTRDISVRMTALSVVGERQEVRCRGDVLSAISGQPALRRVALATLGLIGDERDCALVSEYLQDKDSLVAAAARGAMERLSTPETHSSDRTPQSF